MMPHARCCACALPDAEIITKSARLVKGIHEAWKIEEPYFDLNQRPKRPDVVARLDKLRLRRLRLLGELTQTRSATLHGIQAKARVVMLDVYCGDEPDDSDPAAVLMWSLCRDLVERG